MKYKNIYFEEDEKGKHKVLEQANGIKIKLLREPSEAYKAKMAERAEADRIKMESEDKKRADEKLINDKMKELAIAELKKEGKL